MNSLIDHDGTLNLYPDFLPKHDADRLYEFFLDELAWSAEYIHMFGKTTLAPRLVCWYGDQEASYNYSGVDHTPLPWTESLARLKTKVAVSTQQPFNSVLGNLYRNQNDSMGWHSDDEMELGEDPFIASISLGEARKFKARHKSTGEQVEVTLPHGSMLTMSGPFQRYWQHCVPKTRKPKTQRINLTFRYIKS
ncbi:MAG: alpha-ketoglutarate-dependent dioxygenase AlkB [Gammaproteobacteria bacterium]|nr:alpha-ketoglutarate-dependent dioxygenase AlkB [Gammaproteobacteria bacterium]